MKRGTLKILYVLCLGVAIALVLTCIRGSSGPAHAVVRYSRIEAVPGFRFDNLVYAWDKLTLDVINVDPNGRIFEGTMVFLDRRGKQVARANLLPRNVNGGRAERYIAYFEKGSGETARRATRVIWDFGVR